MQKNLRAGLAAGLALTAAVGISGVAVADKPYPSKQQVQQAQHSVAAKKDSLAAVRKQLASAEAAANTADERAEIAAERYNAAMWKLGRAKKTAAKAQRKAKAAHQKVVDQRAGIANLVVQSYQDGSSLSTVTALLGSGGPEDMMVKTGIASMAGDSLKADYRRFLTLSAAADRAEKAAKRAESKAAGIAATASSQRAAAAAAASHARALSAAVSTKRDQVVKALAKAEHTSVALAKQRQAALEEIARKKAAEKARKAREAAAKAAQQASSGSGSSGSSGTPSTGDPATPSSSGVAAAIAYAKAQLGKPYLWAAAGPDRFDCSGLTMMAWRQGGIDLPHFSGAQYDRTTPVAISDAQPGDLLFWTYNGRPSGIHHVALYIGGGTFIEAPHTGADVRYNTLDNEYPDFAGRL